MTKHSTARNRTRLRKSEHPPAKRPAAGNAGRGKSTQLARIPVRAGTKQATLVDMMRTTAGTSIAQMGTKTGWQPHSVRAALTGLRKRGFAITRERSDAGVTVYRLAEAGK